MGWQHLRRIASGALLCAALVLGGVVGNVVLLRSADTANGTVGQLSARLHGPTATTAPIASRATSVPTRPAAVEAAGERADAGTADD